MNRWSKLLVAVLVLGLVGIADAKGKRSVDGLRGKIVSVSLNSITVATGKQKAGTRTTVIVKTDATTVVTIDGVAKAVRDLQAGERVLVTPTSGTATTIAATSKHHKKAG